MLTRDPARDTWLASAAVHPFQALPDLPLLHSAHLGPDDTGMFTQPAFYMQMHGCSSFPLDFFPIEHCPSPSRRLPLHKRKESAKPIPYP